MDTKLKKSHKLTTIIITLCILVPAFLLTALYPSIATAVQKEEAEYQKLFEEDTEFSWGLQDNFVNYAMEASYHIYGEMLMEAGDSSVKFAALDYWGWTNDYYYLDEQVRYQATYQRENETTRTANFAEEFETEDTVAVLTLSFDSAGLSLVNFEGDEFEDVSNQWLRRKAQESTEQYQVNALEYQAQFDTQLDATQLVPKNFTIEFALDESCDFIYGCEDYYYISTESLLFKVGAVWLIVAAAVFVALFALILPFIKGLKTGWEKPFSIPFELVVVCAAIAVSGIIGMFYAMGETCRLTDYPKLEIIGVPIANHVQYGFLLAANFLGWAACFFLEYVVVSSVRQFLCRPIYYLKHRLLLVIVLRWLKKQGIKLYNYVTEIDISGKLNSSILKIVGVNFAILTLLCCLWFFGIAGLLVYSIALYLVLRHYGEKVQKQYNSILNATNQMAEGNLKIDMEEDLGMFQPIGDSLEKVQQGFEKAVVEEAKSQNMKTELITNVSHDLKTPLTAIITYVDLLKKEGITEEERKAYIATLEQKSQRLKVLIEDLFEVSKAQSGNVTMNFMDVDIVSLMKQVRYEMSDQLEASNLSFRWNLPEEKIVLSLDGQRTYRVFENLLNNALKYSMPYSRVFVDILQTESKVCVVFRNMSAQELGEEAEHLTERFVRGDASRNSEGSGLGLAIAKSFVELQKGELKIDIDGDLFKVILSWNK